MVKVMAKVITWSTLVDFVHILMTLRVTLFLVVCVYDYEVMDKHADTSVTSSLIARKSHPLTGKECYRM